MLRQEIVPVAIFGSADNLVLVRAVKIFSCSLKTKFQIPKPDAVSYVKFGSGILNITLQFESFER